MLNSLLLSPILPTAGAHYWGLDTEHPECFAVSLCRDIGTRIYNVAAGGG